MPKPKESGIVLFNRNSASPWQTYEDVVVMVTSRKGVGAHADKFVRAIDVWIGDNVWEHNIVDTIELLDKPVEGVKWHYGQTKEGPELVEEDEIDKNEIEVQDEAGNVKFKMKFLS